MQNLLYKSRNKQQLFDDYTLTGAIWVKATWGIGSCHHNQQKVSRNIFILDAKGRSRKPKSCVPVRNVLSPPPTPCEKKRFLQTFFYNFSICIWKGPEWSKTYVLYIKKNCSKRKKNFNILRKYLENVQVFTLAKMSQNICSVSEHSASFSLLS